MEERTSSRNSSSNLGWLLRLFKSDFFDAWMAVTYLYKYRGSTGVQDYLCNELYSLNDADLETYLPQLCNLLLHHAKDSVMLQKFIMDKCAESVHLALQVYWFMEAAVADARRVGNRELVAHCQKLRNRCETAAINGGMRSIIVFARRSVGIFDSFDSEAKLSISIEENNTDEDDDDNDTDILPRRSPVAGEVDKVVSALQKASDLAIESSRRNPGVELFNQREREMDDTGSAPGVDPIDQGERVPPSPAEEALLEEIGIAASEIPDIFLEATVYQEEGENMKNVDGKEVPLIERELDELASADPSLLVGVRQERFSYFDDTIMIVKQLVKFSLEIREIPIEERPARLKTRLEGINQSLLRRMAGPNYRCDELVADVIAANGEFSYLRSIHLPLSRADCHVLRVLRINPDETIILNTKTKAPYMLFIEVVETKMLNSDSGVFAEHFFAAQYIDQRKKASVALENEQTLTHAPQVCPRSPGTLFLETMHTTTQSQDPDARTRQIVKHAVYGDTEHVSFGERLIGFDSILETIDEESEKISRSTFAAVYGELWKDREERIIKASPFSVIPGTKLMAFIVKAGDDLRQEQLAVQLIAQFKRIFEDEKVDCFLRPFTIMCSNAESGLIECLTDAVSLHGLKKKTPKFTSVRNYFERAFAPVNSIRFQQAQKRFIQSMAGYSLISYFLQILDRHNGNIMLDVTGRIIHIDFGFMLGNSPGAIRFENSPFKLTDELLEVMASRNDQAFNYFKELFILGFLAARKHHEKITTLVEVMIEGTSMPCMLAGQQVVDELRSRFFLGLLERDCIAKILALIDESYNNWRSKQYDRFQYMTNGIL
uniref:1-phosphatidylinositol 4-kinase n=2 Tax=Compsopogon caeruleus TaxID=31354 RepID=A0A7S1XGJ5_9RHOD